MYKLLIKLYNQYTNKDKEKILLDDSDFEKSDNKDFISYMNEYNIYNNMVLIKTQNSFCILGDNNIEATSCVENSIHN